MLCRRHNGVRRVPSASRSPSHACGAGPSPSATATPPPAYRCDSLGPRSGTLREPALCWSVYSGKGQGWGRGHTWRCECGYKTPGRPRPRPLIYTIYPVIFTVYIYRVITLGRSVSREARGGGPVSLFHSPTFQAWFNHDPHRYEYRLPRFMTRYAMHRSHISKQPMPQPSQAVK
jgi:hypothetical protein